MVIRLVNNPYLIQPGPITNSPGPAGPHKTLGRKVLMAALLASFRYLVGTCVGMKKGFLDPFESITR